MIPPIWVRIALLLLIFSAMLCNTGFYSSLICSSVDHLSLGPLHMRCVP